MRPRIPCSMSACLSRDWSSCLPGELVRGTARTLPSTKLKNNNILYVHTLYARASPRRHGSPRQKRDYPNLFVPACIRSFDYHLADHFKSLSLRRIFSLFFFLLFFISNNASFLNASDSGQSDFISMFLYPSLIVILLINFLFVDRPSNSRNARRRNSSGEEIDLSSGNTSSRLEGFRGGRGARFFN